MFQRFTCDDMKNAGIVTYAVPINNDNEATSRVLQHCPDSLVGAGHASRFFLPTTPTGS